ncbi:MAG: hypothetical protein GY769_16495 [bacterium]|nr:hypothetical protein [bacterium]
MNPVDAIEISPIDALFVHNAYAIEFLFFYESRLDGAQLRAALKRAARHFWPAFGRYADGKLHFERYDESKFYSERTVDETFVVPQTSEGFTALSRAYRSPETRRLFHLRVIHLRNGSVLLPKMNHLVGDGYSYFHLLTSLSLFCGPRLAYPLLGPLFRWFFSPHHSRPCFERPFTDNPAFEEEPEQQLDFVFRKYSAKEVSDFVAALRAKHHLPVSTNDLLSAIAVREILAHQPDTGNQSSALIMPIDMRRHLKSLGKRFFGNGMIFHRVEADVAMSAMSREALALLIRQSLPDSPAAYFNDFLRQLNRQHAEDLLHQARIYDPQTSVLVTNVSRLPLDKLRFAGTAPNFAYPLIADKNGAGIFRHAGQYVIRMSY